MQKSTPFTKDRLGALLLLLLGFGVITEGRSYSVGNLTRMGPGYFPVALGIVLMAIGAVLLVTSWKEKGDEAPEIPDLRGTVLILLGVVAFVVLGSHGGLVPATFASVFIASMGDRQNTVRDAALLGAGMTVTSAVLFHWALQMQFPLFAWGE